MTKHLILFFFFPLVQSITFSQTNPNEDFHLPTPLQIAFIVSMNGVQFNESEINCDIKGKEHDTTEVLQLEYQIALSIRSGKSGSCLPCFRKVIESYSDEDLINEEESMLILNIINNNENNIDSMETALIKLGDFIDNAPRQFLLIRYLSSWMASINSLVVNPEFTSNRNMQRLFAENCLLYENILKRNFTFIKSSSDAVIKADALQEFFTKILGMAKIQEFKNGNRYGIQLSEQECADIKYLFQKHVVNTNKD